MPDPLYVRARTALLDAVDAFEAHLNAVVLVGAQAVRLHTGDADLTVAAYTTDADFTVSPRDLADTPLLAELLVGAGFTPREHPGGWLSPNGVYVDLMVPEALAGPGRRSARLGPHGKRAARRAKGLESSLVDRDRATIAALDPGDRRIVTMWVAGPGALLVAKVHKIAERVGTDDRVRDKDALDVLRLLRAVDMGLLAERLSRLEDDERSRNVTDEALAALPGLFASPERPGVAMAVRTAGASEHPDTIVGSFVALVEELTSQLHRR